MKHSTDVTVLYTPTELAELLKVKRHTIYQWIRAKKLTAVHAGNCVRVTEDDLKAFLTQRH